MSAFSPDWSVLETADVTTRQGRAALRKSVVKPLILRDDYRKAAAVLEVILDESGESSDRLQLARMQGLGGGVDAAMDTLRAARSEAPEDAEIARAYVAMSLRLNNPKRAAEAARSTQHLWGANAALADAATRALYRAGDMASALKAARISVSQNSENASALTFAASVFNAAGRASEAQNMLLSHGDVMRSAEPEQVFELARAMYLLAPDSEDALAFLAFVHEARPENKRFADLYARCLYSRGDAASAIGVIERTETMVGSVAGALLYARCLRQQKRYHDAADVVTALEFGGAESDSIRRFATGILQLAGRHQEAQKLAAETREQARRRLASDLATSLNAIADNLHNSDIRQARIDWSWRHVRALARGPIERERWVSQVKWVNMADSRLREWLEYSPGGISDIASLIDIDAESSKTVKNALSEGKGAVIATTHVGALFSGPVALGMLGHPISFVASTPSLDDGQVPGAPHARLISAASLDPVSLARQIIRDLSNGRIVAIAVDGSVFPGSPRFKLFDRTIGLSDFVPRRAFRSDIPTFYSDMRWDDGRIKATLNTLPRSDGAPEDEFVQSWMTAVTAQVEALFHESPANLRLAGGFWNSIKC